MLYSITNIVLHALFLGPLKKFADPAIIYFYGSKKAMEFHRNKYMYKIYVYM